MNNASVINYFPEVNAPCNLHTENQLRTCK
jgi:hypothetical protein